MRNVYAQVVLTTAHGNPEALERAYRLATDTIVETRRTGMVRSEIAALSLLGQVRLAQADTAGAADFARQAVQTLERTGDMPALRSEEVLYHAARALNAIGAGQEALTLLEQAREKVARKAGSLDEETRRVFTREPLNRLIALGRLGELGGE